MGASNQEKNQLPLKHRAVSYFPDRGRGICDQHCEGEGDHRVRGGHHRAQHSALDPRCDQPARQSRSGRRPCCEVRIASQQISKFSCIIITEVMFQGENLTMGVLADSVAR